MNTTVKAYNKVAKIEQELKELQTAYYNKRDHLQTLLKEANQALEDAKTLAREQERSKRVSLAYHMNDLEEWVKATWSSKTISLVGVSDFRAEYELHVGHKVHRGSFNSTLYKLGLKQKVARTADGVVKRVWYKP